MELLEVGDAGWCSFLAFAGVEDGVDAGVGLVDDDCALVVEAIEVGGEPFCRCVVNAALGLLDDDCTVVVDAIELGGEQSCRAGRCVVYGAFSLLDDNSAEGVEAT